MSATNTVQRLREYLTVLRAVIDDRTVDFHGSQVTANAGPRTIEGFIAPIGCPAATEKELDERRGG